MKNHRVIVTPDAENDLKTYLAYLRDVKRNPQVVFDSITRKEKDPHSKSL